VRQTSGGSISTALAATVIALAVVVLALGGLVAFLVYRARRERPAGQISTLTPEVAD
jgi:hypothetical protein